MDTGDTLRESCAAPLAWKNARSATAGDWPGVVSPRVWVRGRPAGPWTVEAAAAPPSRRPFLSGVTRRRQIPRSELCLLYHSRNRALSLSVAPSVARRSSSIVHHPLSTVTVHRRLPFIVHRLPFTVPRPPSSHYHRPPSPSPSPSTVTVSTPFHTGFTPLKRSHVHVVSAALKCRQTAEICGSTSATVVHSAARALSARRGLSQLGSDVLARRPAPGAGGVGAGGSRSLSSARTFSLGARRSRSAGWCRGWGQPFSRRAGRRRRRRRRSGQR